MLKKRKLSLLLVFVFLVICAIPHSGLAQSADPLDDAIEKGFAYYQSGGEIYTPEILGQIGEQYMTLPEWLTLAAGRAGKTYEYHAYIEKVQEYFDANLETEAKRAVISSTDLNRFALALAAAGGDPTAFEVNGAPVDLIAEGVYNRTSGTISYNNALIWALITLDSGDYAESGSVTYSRTNLKTSILGMQNSNGSFRGYDNTGEDMDMTAMGIIALAPYYDETNVKTVVDKAIDYLASKQLFDGTFADSWSGTSSSSTTAQVLVALTSLGIDCRRDERFIQNEKTIIDGILQYQKTNGTFATNFDTINDPLPDYGSEQTLGALVAYQRFAQNKSNYYDFHTANGSMTLRVTVGGENRTIPFVKSQPHYDLKLMEDADALVFTAIPKSPYERANTTLNMPIPFVNHQAFFEVTGRYGTTRYTITKIPPTVDEVLGNEIGQLPDRITDLELDTVLRLLNEYEALSMEERALITNYQELQLKYLTYIQGKELTYTTSGITPEGHKYTWTIQGEDITAPMAFDTDILLTSPNQQAIVALSPEAFVMHFVHEGTLPGKAKVEMETRLADGVLELLYFNGTYGEIIAEVSNQNGTADFSIEHCSDYYLQTPNDPATVQSSSSNTGDTNYVVPLLIVLGVSLAFLVIVVQLKKRARKS